MLKHIAYKANKQQHLTKPVRHAVNSLCKFYANALCTFNSQLSIMKNIKNI